MTNKCIYLGLRLLISDSWEGQELYKMHHVRNEYMRKELNIYGINYILETISWAQFNTGSLRSTTSYPFRFRTTDYRFKPVEVHVSVRTVVCVCIQKLYKCYNSRKNFYLVYFSILRYGHLVMLNMNFWCHKSRDLALRLEFYTLPVEMVKVIKLLFIGPVKSG